MIIQPCNSLRTFDSRPAVINANPQFLMKWRKALANVRMGVSNATVICIGDSTTHGSYSDATLAGFWSQSMPARLAWSLVQLGIPAGNDSRMGDGNSVGNGTFATYDPRCTLGAGWGVNGTPAPGAYWWNNATTANPFVFTPTNTFDSADLYYIRFVGGGTLTFDIDGAGTITLNTNGAFNTLKSTLNKGSPGSAVNLIRTAGSCFFSTVVAYTQASAQVNVINGGWISGTTNDYATIAAIADTHNFTPDLTIIELGINDMHAPVAQSTISANLQTIINVGLQTGDVLLVSPHPVVTSWVAQGVQNACVGGYQSLALLNNLWLVDLTARFKDEATMLADGFIYTDGVHPLRTGYDDEAAFLASLLAYT